MYTANVLPSETTDFIYFQNHKSSVFFLETLLQILSGGVQNISSQVFCKRLNYGSCSYKEKVFTFLHILSVVSRNSCVNSTEKPTEFLY